MGSIVRSGRGGVIRNMHGEWIVGYMSNQHTDNHIKAKLLKLIQGLHIALARQLAPLEINIDCKELIDYIENDHPSYTNMLFDCRNLLRQMRNPLIRHSYREAYRVADTLAKERAKLTEENSFLWMEVPPVFVSGKLESDKGGTFFLKPKKPVSM